ncbi:MAG: Ig-like domain-containing protein [Rhodospirillales bacterium]
MTGARILEARSVSVNGDGTLSYNPGAGFQSPAWVKPQVRIEYTVDDGAGGQIRRRLSRSRATNDGPVASDDTASATEDGGVVTFNVLANDSDVDGDALTVTSAKILEGRRHGLGQPDGTLSYNPGAGFQSLGVGETAQVRIEYTVDDGAGGTDTAVAVVTVTGTNEAPVASNDRSAAVDGGGPVVINVLNNDSDIDGGSLSVTGAAILDGAEGSVTVNSDGTLSYDPGPGFQHLSAGLSATVRIEYTVSDGQGGTDTAIVSVKVVGVNDAPIASDDTASAAEDGGVVTFNVLANDSDAEGDALTVTSAKILEGAEGSVTVNPDGTLSYNPGAGFQSLGAGETAQVRIEYTVDDGAGGTDTAVATVTVTGTNDGPVASDDTASAVEDGGAVTFNVLANDADVDGDDLSVTSANIVNGAEGTVAINGDGTLSFDPGAGFQSLAEGETAEVRIEYTVDDGNGGTDTAIAAVTVTGTNDGPVASDDSLFIFEDQGTLAFNVLTNDSDVDGDSIFVLSARILDGAEGSVLFSPDGAFVFKTDAAFNHLAVGETAEVRIEYTIADGNGGTDTAVATVTITGTNDGPVASNDRSGAAEDGGAVVINVLANDSDIDGDSLSVTSANILDGAEGSVTVNPDGTLSYDPGAGFQSLAAGEIASVRIEYTVSDGQGGTDTAIVSVKVVGANDGPVASNDTAPVSAVEDGGPVTFNVLANDSDVEGDALTVTSARILEGAEGSVIVNSDGTLSYNSGTGFQSLGVGETAEVRIEYTVDDGNGGTDTAVATVTVTGTNDGPTAAADTASAVEDGGPVTFNVLANDSDIDGDTEFSVTGARVLDGAEGTVTVNPDGTLSYDPGAGFQSLGVGETAQVRIEYTVSDENGGTGTGVATVTVTGTNDAPAASDDTAPVSAVEDGGVVTFNVLANDSDIDGDALSVTGAEILDGAEGSVTVNPDGTLSFDPGAGFQSLAAGETVQVRIEYTIDDGHGGTDTAIATVTVTGTNDAPVATDGRVLATEDRGTLFIGVLSNSSDVDGDSLSVTGARILDGGEGTVTIGEFNNVGYSTDGGFQSLGVGETAQVRIEYTVSDGRGGTDTAVMVVTVTGTNDGPVASDDTASAAEDGGAVVINVLANDSDIDGDSLSVTGATILDGGEGSVTVNGDGAISYNPGANFQSLGAGETAEIRIQYTMDDGNGGTDTAVAVVTVTGTNDGPVATDDTASAAEDGGAVVINVLNNDSDVEGDTLSVTSAVILEGAEGTVSINPDGTLSYNPGAGFQSLGAGETAEVRIEYTVSDGNGGTDTAVAVVTVTGTNDGPAASDDTGSATEDGGAVAVNVLNNDSDVEGDSLSVTGATILDGGEGTVSVKPDGTLSYNPGAGFQSLGVGETAQVRIEYTVSDGQGGTDTAIAVVTVTGANDGPVASDDTASAAEDGGPVVINVLSNDADVDGDSLSVTGATILDGGEGTVSINPDGTLSYDPGPGFQSLGVGETAEVRIEYAVDDGNGGTDTAVVVVTVTGTNDGLAMSPDYSSVREDGGPITINVLANDVDIDGDALSLTGASVVEGAGSVDTNPDGTITYDPGPEFQYLGVGQSVEVRIEYTLSDGQGATGTGEAFITVLGANDGPVAADDTASAVEDGGAVAINVMANDVDIDGGSLSLVGVSLAEGAGSVAMNPDGTVSYDPGAEFQYLGAGETAQVRIEYTVGDEQGVTDTAIATVTVTGVNDAPVAADDTALAAEDGGAVVINVLANDTDVDGDSLSVTSANILEGGEGEVSINPDGTLSYNPGAGFQSLGVGETAQVRIEYTVDDGNGGTDTAVATVIVTGTNDSPVASDDTASATEDGGAVVINVLANDGDVESDALSVTGATVLDGAQGSVAINGDGTLSYNPGAGFQSLAAGETAQVRIEYTVDDGNGGTDTAIATVTVTGTNDGPVAAADTASAAEDGGVVVINVLANDSDIDGDSLSVTSANILDGAEGAVSINPDGTLSYNPGANFQGLGVGETAQVRIEYTISDGAGGTDTAVAVVTVTGTNDGPAAVNDYSYTFEDDGPVTVNVLDNDSDVDGDSLSVTSAKILDDAPGTVTVNSDGTISYDPGAGFEHLGNVESAEVRIEYTVSDGNGGTDTAVVTIAVFGENDGPTAAADTASATEDGGAVVINVLANDSDVDGDSLSVTGATVLDGAQGSVTVNSDGTLSYNPGAGFQSLAEGETAQVRIEYTVDDGNGGTDTAVATVTVTGTNDGPVASDDTASATEDGGAVVINVLANDSDVDGDSLSVTSANILDGAEGTVSVNSDGTLSYNPGAGFQSLGAGETAQVRIEYTIDDGAGGTDTAIATVTVTGTNDAPVAAADTASATEDGGAVVINVLANDSDVDGNSLSVTGATILGGAEGSVTVNPDGTLSYNPGAGFQSLAEGETAQVRIEYTVDDGAGGTDTAIATVTVTGTNDAPVAGNLVFGAWEDQQISFTNAHLMMVSSDPDTSDNNTLTVVSVDQPADGAVTSDGEGGYIFTPEANFSGQTSFSFTIADSSGATDSAMFTANISPVADAPVLTAAAGESALVMTSPNTTTAVTVNKNNVTDTSGDFTVTPTGGSLAVVGNPGGFGVGGGSGEINNPESVEIRMGAGVYSAEYRVAWLNAGAVAKAEIYRGNLKVGEHTVNNGTDGIDGPYALSAGDGGIFDMVVFTAPAGDFLVHDFTYYVQQYGDIAAETPLNITAALADAGETLSNVTFDLSLAPAGAVLSAGVDNGDGTWSVTSADLSGLQVETAYGAPDFLISLSVTSSDSGGGGSAVTETTVFIDTPGDAVTVYAPPGGSPYLMGLHGAEQNDTLSGQDGADGIFGYGGADVLYGDYASYTAQADGADMIYGGGGDDVIYGGGAGDSISGGAGNDIIHGDLNTYAARGGDDIINAGEGNDTVYGQDGDDKISGSGGDDVIYGDFHTGATAGDGADKLYGDAGNDTLYGGAGDDEMHGGAGADIIRGGVGDDIATGGVGDDLFIFGAGDGTDMFDGGAGWTDTVSLEGVTGGPGDMADGADWTLITDDAYTVNADGDYEFEDGSGVIQMADGSEVTFHNVERIEW